MAQLIYNKQYEIGGFESTIESTIDHIIQNDQLKDFYLIVPTKKSVAYFSKLIYRKHFAKYGIPISKPNIFNLADFIEFIFDKLPNAKDFLKISSAYQYAIFEKVVQNTELSYFRRNNNKLSDHLVKELFETIYGLKEDGITLDSFKSRNNLESKKVQDIKILIEKYNISLENLLDNAGLVETTNQIINDYLYNNQINLLEKIFDKKSKIISFGFSEFKQPEFKFISNFANTNIQFAMNIDYSTNNGPIFSNLYESINILVNDLNFKLLDLTNDEKDINPQVPYNDKTLKTTYLKRWLFYDHNIIKNPNFEDNIEIYKCDDKKSEITFVAKKIKELVNSGIAYSEICVCFRQPETYTGYIRDIFNQHRIPSFVSDRFNLSNSNLISAIFSVFDIVLNGYKKDSLQKALRSRFIRFTQKDESEINIENLMNIASIFRISSNSRAQSHTIWENTINNRIYLTEKALNQISPELQEYYFKERELLSYKQAKRDFEIIRKQLNFSDKLYTLEELESIIKINVIENLQIRSRILEFNQSIINSQIENDFERISIKENLEKDAKALKSFVKVLDEQIKALKSTNSSDSIKLSDFINQLKVAVSATKYNVKEKENFGVLVTATEQIRNIPYKYSFLCGLIDGEFPLAYNPRKVFGIDLPETKYKHEESERMNFYQFLTNNPNELNFGEKKIFLTYPINNENEVLVASQFIEALKRKTNLQEKSIPNHYEYTISSGYEISKYYKHLNHSDLIDNNINIKHNDYKFTNINNNQDIPNINIENNHIKLLLDSYVNNPISPSHLDNYAGCNYRHLISKLFRLKEIQEDEEDLSSMELGNLYHEILYRFFETLKQDSLHPKVMINNQGDKKIEAIELSGNISDYFELLLKITEEVINNSFELGINKTELFNKLIGIRNSDGIKHKGILPKWLENELNYNKILNNPKPAFFEYSFGSKKNPQNVIELFGDNNRSIKINGKIDRIDLLNDNEEIKFKIIDYKTSKSKKFHINNILNGKLFQLVLYTYAFETILRNEYGLNSIPDNFSYCIIKPNKDKNEYYFNLYNADNRIIIKNQLTIQDVCSINLELALNNMDKIRSGYFNPTEDKDECNYCKYGNICRIEELRKK